MSILFKNKTTVIPNINPQVFENIFLRLEVQEDEIQYIMCNVLSYDNDDIIYTRLLSRGKDFMFSLPNVTISTKVIFEDAPVLSDERYRIVLIPKTDFISESTLLQQQNIDNVDLLNRLNIQEVSTDRREIRVIPIGGRDNPTKEHFLNHFERLSEITVVPTPAQQQMQLETLENVTYIDLLRNTTKRIIETNMRQYEKTGFFERNFDELFREVSTLKTATRLQESNFSRLFLKERLEVNSETGLTETMYDLEFDPLKAFKSMTLLYTRMWQTVSKLSGVTSDGSLFRNIPFISKEVQFKLIAKALLEDCTFLFSGEDVYNVSDILIDRHMEYKQEYAELPLEVQRKWNIVNRRQIIPILAYLSGSDIPEGEDVINYGEGYILEANIAEFRKTLIEQKPRSVVLTVYEVLYNVFVEEYERIFSEYISTQISLKYSINFNENLDSIKITNFSLRETDTGNVMIIKLATDLPISVNVYDSIWITQDSAPILRIAEIQSIDPGVKLFKLRPANLMDISDNASSIKHTIESISQVSGSITSQDVIDSVFKNVYKNATEIKVDFSDFNKFIKYSSAKRRIENFESKLGTLEVLNTSLNELQNISGSLTSGSVVSEEIKTVQTSIQTVKRGFDNWERYLYSGTTYTAYPKISGVVAPLASASVNTQWQSWKNEADDYDGGNINLLTNSLPTHVSEDPNNDAFIVFVDMLAHYFDGIWMYIDNMPRVWSREDGVETGVSSELIWNVAKSLGFDTFHNKNIHELSAYLFGVSPEGNEFSKTLEEYTSEVSRRGLNNLIYMYKTKGTHNSIRALINTYGIPHVLLSVYETASDNSELDKHIDPYVFDVDSTVLNVKPSKTLEIPWEVVTGTSEYPQTVEVRFNVHDKSTQILFRKNEQVYVKLNYVSGDNGFVSVHNQADTMLLSSSVLPLYDRSMYDLALSNNIADGHVKLHLYRYDYGFLNEIETSVDRTFTTSWEQTGSLYIGSNGTLVGNWFSGSIDTVRLWSETLTTDIIQAHAKFPFSKMGLTERSFAEHLLIYLGFEDPGTVEITGDLLSNEAIMTSYVTNIQATNFTTSDFSQIIEFVELEAFGLTIPGTFKVRTGNNIATQNELLYNESVVKYDATPKVDNIVNVLLSPTKQINYDIYRHIPFFRIDNFIGDPRDNEYLHYPELDDFNNTFWNLFEKQVSIINFIKLLGFFDSTLFAQLKQLVPSRVNLKTGLLIEPHVLERPRSNVGAHRITKQDRRYDADIDQYPEYELEGIQKWLETELSGSLFEHLSGSLNAYFGSIDIEDYREIMAKSNTPSTKPYVAPKGIRSSHISGSIVTYITDPNILVKRDPILVVEGRDDIDFELVKLLSNANTGLLNVEWQGGNGPFSVVIGTSGSMNGESIFDTFASIKTNFETNLFSPVPAGSLNDIVVLTITDISGNQLTGSVTYNW